MWIRLLLSCLQRKSNKPVRFIISSVDSAAESTGDTAIYWESPLTLLSMATRSPLFVLLFEYKVLSGDPIPRLPVDLQSTGSCSSHAQQTTTEPLNCNPLTFQLKEKVMKRETCSEARSSVHVIFLTET